METGLSPGGVVVFQDKEYALPGWGCEVDRRGTSTPIIASASAVVRDPGSTVRFWMMPRPTRTFKGTTHFEFAEDIQAGLLYLKTRPEIDATRMGLVGHSEGALDAAIVASKQPEVRAIVLLAGQARPLRQSLERQLNDLIRHNTKLSPAQQDSAVATTPRTADSILAADRYMGTIVAYDPSATARQVKSAAVLILTGATDRQADPTQVQEWVDAFKAPGNRDVTGRVMPNLNHLFAYDTDGSPSNYAKLPVPIRMDPMVVGLVVDWLVQRLH